MSARPDQQLHRITAAGLQPMLLASAFVAAFVLGVIGYREAEPDLDLITAQYKSLQLFVMEGGVVEGDTPWSLEVARFLAPLVLAYAAIRAIMILARDRLTIWKTRLLARGHVVVAGDSPDVPTIVDGLLAAGRSVVVITPTPSLLDGHRERGAAVLSGDPRDPQIVARARPERSSDVVIVSANDADALQALAACERITGLDHGPAIHVGLREPRLWEELHSVGFAIPTTRSAEFFLDAEREARILLRGMTAPALQIEGEGLIVQRLVIAAGRAALIDERAIEVTLGPRAAASLAGILGESPWLTRAATFAEERDPLDGGSCAAVVAGMSDAAGIAYGVRLARANAEARVRVAIDEGAVEDALARAGLGAPNLELVPSRVLALGPALLEDSAIEVLARAKHDDYVARETARGVSPAENPSIAVWDDLPESLKESNRRYAQSVAQKLSAFGASLTPLTAAAESWDLEIEDPLLSDLARAEHERWVRDLLADGWQPTTGQKDPDRRLHPLLVSWDDLDEVEREKARDGIRALPALLGRAGYGLTVAHDRAPAKV